MTYPPRLKKLIRYTMRATELIARETRCGRGTGSAVGLRAVCPETQDASQKRQSQRPAASPIHQAKIWIGKNEGSGAFTKLLIMIKYEVDFLIIIGAHWSRKALASSI